MYLPEIKRVFEKRREDLIELLQSGNLDPGRQHQIYGAIKEIEVFLRTLDHYIHKKEDTVDFKLKK